MGRSTTFWGRHGSRLHGWQCRVCQTAGWVVGARRDYGMGHTHTRGCEDIEVQCEVGTRSTRLYSPEETRIAYKYERACGNSTRDIAGAQ